MKYHPKLKNFDSEFCLKALRTLALGVFVQTLNRLNPHEFAKVFTQWVCTLGDLHDDILALDGKVMRGTLD